MRDITNSERVACLVYQTVFRLLERAVSSCDIIITTKNYGYRKKNYYWLISEKPVKTNRNNSKIAKNLKSQNSAIFNDFRWFLKIVQNFFEIENFSWIKFFSCMKQKWVIILKNLKKFENGVRREILEDPKSEIQDILISWVTVENKLNNSEFTPL